MRLGTLRREAPAGWIGLELRSHSPARRTAQSGPPRTTVAPTNTNHPRACQWDKAAYSRQAEERPGRAGAAPEEAAPPPGCSAPQSSTSPAKREMCLSDRHTEKTASFVSQLACVKQISVRFTLLQQSRKGQFCPSRRKGIPDASSSTWRDSRCHVVWLSQNLCAVDKLLFRSRNSRLSGWLSDQTLFHYVPTESHAANKR